MLICKMYRLYGLKVDVNKLTILQWHHPFTPEQNTVMYVGPNGLNISPVEIIMTETGIGIWLMNLVTLLPFWCDVCLGLLWTSMFPYVWRIWFVGRCFSVTNFNLHQKFAAPDIWVLQLLAILWFQYYFWVIAHPLKNDSIFHPCWLINSVYQFR